MTKILLTGGSGFIAAHILEQLLEGGHTVVTSVRSEDKASKIRQAHASHGDRLQFQIVKDIAQPDAFDEAVKVPGLEVVMHTASPFHFNFTDPKKELIDPALVGTTSILKAVKRSAPSVKRIIVTSSFAAILTEGKLNDPSHTFTEASWNPDGINDITRSPATAYRVSKTLAERAAWDFVANEKPNFDLVTVNPPLVLGPVVHALANFDSINTSNERVVAMLQGKWKTEIAGTGAVGFWVDVRDCAKAHVLAMEKPEAGGHRLFTTPGGMCNRDIVDITRANFPEFADRLPGPDVKGGDPPAGAPKIDNSETNKILGFEYISIEKCVTDLVKSLKELGI